MRFSKNVGAGLAPPDVGANLCVRPKKGQTHGSARTKNVGAYCYTPKKGNKDHHYAG